MQEPSARSELTCPLAGSGLPFRWRVIGDHLAGSTPRCPGRGPRGLLPLSHSGGGLYPSWYRATCDCAFTGLLGGGLLGRRRRRAAGAPASWLRSSRLGGRPVGRANGRPPAQMDGQCCLVASNESSGGLAHEARGGYAARSSSRLSAMRRPVSISVLFRSSRSASLVLHLLRGIGTRTLARPADSVGPTPATTGGSEWRAAYPARDEVISRRRGARSSRRVMSASRPDPRGRAPRIPGAA